MERQRDPYREARRLRDQLVGWRRDFHRHPELGFEEVRTAGIVARELAGLGYRVQTGVAKTGVVGLLEGSGPGPVVMLRFDMDALPIQEANEVEYASTLPGKMHACGHDGHVAIGLGAARLLACYRGRWGGMVKLAFQPAEEGRGGGELMVRDGVLCNPPVDAVFALHLWNDLPVGQAAITAGPVMAASDRWELTIRGKGGHGARPHQAVDPTIIGAHVIIALQTIVSRSLDPLEPAVVSVGTIRAGQAFNIIPPQVELTGSLRTFAPEARETALRRFEEIVGGVCRAMGGEADLRIVPTCPAVINDGVATEVMRAAAAAVLGPDNVRSGERTMGSEDAAFYLKEVPGCYMFLGAANPDRALDHPIHHPHFDFDEDALPLGAAIMAEACLVCSRQQ